MKGMLIKGLSVMVATFALGNLSAKEEGKDRKSCSCDRAPEKCDHVNLCAPYPSSLCNFLHLDIGFLVEKAAVSGTQFAHTVEGIGADGLEPAPCDYPKHGHILRPHFKFAWGVVASAGYFFDHDSWFLFAKYEWLRSHGRYCHSCSAGEYVVPHGIVFCNIRAGAPPANNVDSAVSYKHTTSHIEVNNNHLLFLLERGVNLTDRFSIHPAAGLQTDWIHVKQKSIFAPEDKDPTDLTHKRSSKFWGIGPHFALETRWHLFGELSGFSNFGTGLLFGETKTHDVVYANKDEGNKKTDYHSHSHQHTMSPSLFLSLGLLADRMICDETQRIAIRASFDTAFWWNQNETIYGQNGLYNGDNALKPTFWLDEEHTVGRFGFKLSIEYEF